MLTWEEAERIVVRQTAPTLTLGVDVFRDTITSICT